MTITTTQRTAGSQEMNLFPVLAHVLDGTFRANPSYDLVSFDLLSPEHRELFASLRDDPEFYGVLLPREGSHLPLKSACSLTAKLFSSLPIPGQLPRFARSGKPGDANHAIVQLVLDGVLQILHNGDLLHGPAALHAVSAVTLHEQAEDGTARLSRDALTYAQALPFTEASALSSRLYSYGRIPATPSWKRLFPNEESLRRCLGVEEGGVNAMRLARRWKPLPADPDNDGWLFWHSTSPSSTGRIAEYKLYLSPHPAFHREAFDAMIPALEASRANAFKVGKDLSGVLRPDKMIAYFSRFDQLEDAAGRIHESLAGCPAQGVPFTAQFETPLVSWGADPPAEKDVPPWLARQSWRLWITNRLAVALIAAKHHPNLIGIEPWQFALDRLRLEGVDTNTWSPLRKEN